MSISSSSLLGQMYPRKHFLGYLVLAAIGAIVASIGLYKFVGATASVHWPSTLGKVVESSVAVEHDSDSTIHRAKILYEYSVGGRTFKGSRVSYGEYSSTGSSHARTVVNRYPKGRTVTVYYSPENPQECLLEPGVKGPILFLLGCGLLCVLVGSYAAIQSRWK